MTKMDILTTCFITVALTAFSLVDIRRRSIHIFAIAGFLTIMLALAIISRSDVNKMLVGLIPGTLTMILSIASKGKVGIGDGMILAGIGIWCGLQETLSIYFVSLLICSLVGVMLMINKKASIKTELPFLPFLLVGYLACSIAKGYLKAM